MKKMRYLKSFNESKENIEKSFSDFRLKRLGRKLSEREENVLKSKFDTFYKDYMDCYSIGDRSTYDRVIYFDIFEDDGFYYMRIDYKDKRYYFKVDGFDKLSEKIKKWEKKIV